MNLRRVMSERAMASRKMGPRAVAGPLARCVLAHVTPLSTLACHSTALSRGENRDRRHNDAMLGAFATAWGRPAC